MNATQGRIGRAADRFMDLGSAVYGDERERAVFTEAATFGFALGIYVNLAVALMAAVLGSLAVPAVVLALLAVPGGAALWYARRHDVEVEDLANRVGLGGRVATLLMVFGGVLLTMGAMAFTVFTGHGLVRLPVIDVAGPEATGVLASLVQGAVIGGLGGGVLGLVAILASVRSRARRATAGPADAEED